MVWGKGGSEGSFGKLESVLPLQKELMLEHWESSI